MAVNEYCKTTCVYYCERCEEIGTPGITPNSSICWCCANAGICGGKDGIWPDGVVFVGNSRSKQYEDGVVRYCRHFRRG